MIPECGRGRGVGGWRAATTALPIQRLGASRQRLGQAGLDGVAHAGYRQQGLGFLNGAAMSDRPWSEMTVWMGERVGDAVIAARMCCLGWHGAVLFQSGRLLANLDSGHVVYYIMATHLFTIPHKSKGPTDGRASRRYTGLQSPCCVTASRGGLKPDA